MAIQEPVCKGLAATACVAAMTTATDPPNPTSTAMKALMMTEARIVGALLDTITSFVSKTCFGQPGGVLIWDMDTLLQTSGRRSGAKAQRGEEAARIAAALREQIIGGAFEQDARLGQDALATQFSVSRMPVRDALRQLEAEGFVVAAPNCGARVAPVSVDDLLEIGEMRVAAETLALKTALPNLSNAHIGRAAAIQADLEAAPTARFGELNNAFHMILYEPCNRPRLLAHIRNLGHAADRYLQMTVARLDYARASHEEHRMLIEACRNRDETAALDCLTRHIERACQALAGHLQGMAGKR